MPCACSSSEASSWQGVHHEAQKFSTTTFPRSDASVRVPLAPSIGSATDASGARGYCLRATSSSSVRLADSCETPYTSSAISAAPTSVTTIGSTRPLIADKVRRAQRAASRGRRLDPTRRRAPRPRIRASAAIAQLVERKLPKLEVAGSRPVRRLRGTEPYLAPASGFGHPGRHVSLYRAVMGAAVARWRPHQVGACVCALCVLAAFGVLAAASNGNVSNGNESRTALSVASAAVAPYGNFAQKDAKGLCEDFVPAVAVKLVRSVSPGKDCTEAAVEAFARYEPLV